MNILNIFTTRAYKYTIVTLFLIVVFMGIDIYKYKNSLKLLKIESEATIKNYKTKYKNTLKERNQFEEYFKNCESGLDNLQKYYEATNEKVKEYQTKRRKHEKVKLNSLDDVIDFAKRLQSEK